MVVLNQTDMSCLNMFSNLSRIEVESPLLSTDRIDETQICLSRFGYIRVAFSSDNTPIVEKFFDQVEKMEENKQSSTYFFTPIWQRESDPYKTPLYPVSLVGWKVVRGGIEPSAQQQNILERIEKALANNNLFIQR